MIRINLLPEKEVKRRRRRVKERAAVPTRQVSPMTIVIAVVVFGLVGSYAYFFVHRRLANQREANDSQRQELARLDKQIEGRKDAVQELKDAEQIAESMLDIVYALDPEDRLLWSKKLNQLSDLLPDSVYITRITVTERIQRKETLASQRRRKEYQEEVRMLRKTQGRRARPSRPAPAPIYYPEVVQTLQIAAIAYSESGPERIRLIDQFRDHLTSGRHPKRNLTANFMEGFAGTLDYGDISQAVVGGRNVARFSFILRTKPTAPKAGGRAGGS
jgi:Tfp pilus assembly protein PilN